MNKGWGRAWLAGVLGACVALVVGYVIDEAGNGWNFAGWLSSFINWRAQSSWEAFGSPFPWALLGFLIGFTAERLIRGRPDKR